MDYLLYLTLILILYLTYESSCNKLVCKRCGKKLNEYHYDKFGKTLRTCKNKCNAIRQKY